MKIRLSILLVLLCPTSMVLAWGTGHDNVAQAVFGRLSQPLREAFSAQVVRHAVTQFSHYPDSMEPFPVEDIGRAALDRLQAMGFKKRHDLHSDTGRAMAFALLVDALRDKDSPRAALWIAAMSHSIADMAACNHDPLVHTATYGWSAWELKLPDGSPFKPVNTWLDLHATARDTDGGKKAFEQAVARMILADDGRTVETTLAELMAYGQEGARFCSPRGVPILAGASAWIMRRDASAREEMWRNMAELGAWAVARTLRDVEVAARLAKAGRRVEITPQIRSAYLERIEAILRQRKLSEDALFAPLLRNLPAESEPAIGVVLEPTWQMNEGMLGFNSRVQAAAIARTLGQQKRPYATLDLRSVLADGFPLPEKMPVVIVVATQFSGYHFMKTDDFSKHLARYLERGGHVLWIAGTARLPDKPLACVAKAMKKEEKKSLPIEDARFVGSRLRLDTDKETGVWKFARPPRTPAGWQQPLCPWRFELQGQADLLPLLTLESEGLSLVVGAVTSDRRIACLPIYALVPHLLEGTNRLASPSEPSLDAAGTAILSAVLQHLR